MTEQERYVHNIVTEILAERVVQKLLERQKQALVVYTGSNMGIEPGLECLRMLRQEEGFTYRVLLTRSAAELLDVSAIRSALEPEELWVERPESSPEALTARYDTILVPALTVNTAAHVAACMADTPAAAIILDGLMRGKNVIAAVDGCCPDNPERIKRGFHMTEALKGKLRENKNTLREFGAYLTTSEQLGETARKAILSFVPGFDSMKSEPQIRRDNKSQSKAAAGTFHAVLEGRVFSEKHIKSYPDQAVVIVPKRTIITQLASDAARRRGIRIEIES
ncbi:MAG: hypothetical protein HFH41_01890 [Lachnospiraceae bacterium]|nr:hypothetical protein [Lachnospiraceae bacterium]